MHGGMGAVRHEGARQVADVVRGAGLDVLSRGRAIGGQQREPFCGDGAVAHVDRDLRQAADALGRVPGNPGSVREVEAERGFAINPDAPREARAGRGVEEELSGALSGRDTVLPLSATRVWLQENPSATTRDAIRGVRKRYGKRTLAPYQARWSDSNGCA